MKKKSVGQRLYGDNYNPKSKEKSTETIDEINAKYKKARLYSSFNLNPLYSPIKYEIDEKLNPFFDKWIELSQDESKQTLKEKRTQVRDIFYDIAFKQIYKDVYLMNALTMIDDSKKKIEEGDNSIIQKIIVKAGLGHFIPIVDEVFEIPNLILSAFESSSNSLNKQIKHLTREKELLHNQLDRENSEDKRIPKLKVDKIIKEFLTNTEYDKSLLDDKTELGKEIKKWSDKKYPHKKPSINTIIPKLSNSELEFPELINKLKSEK